jgi:hypothetical protein
MTLACAPADGSKSELQLEEVTLASTGSELTVTWVTNEDPRATVGYFAQVESEDGNSVYLIGADLSDEYVGRPSSFVQPLRSGLPASLLPLAQYAPSKTFTATFPLSRMPGIGESFAWSAILTGEDRDEASYCPAGAKSVAYPDMSGWPPATRWP